MQNNNPLERKKKIEEMALAANAMTACHFINKFTRKVHTHENKCPKKIF